MKDDRYIQRRNMKFWGMFPLATYNDLASLINRHILRSLQKSSPSRRKRYQDFKKLVGSK